MLLRRFMGQLVFVADQLPLVAVVSEGKDIQHTIGDATLHEIDARGVVIGLSEIDVYKPFAWNLGTENGPLTTVDSSFDICFVLVGIFHCKGKLRGEAFLLEYRISSEFLIET